MALWRRFSRARKVRGEAASRLYRAVVDRAREPSFFADLGVPDTVDGRFEMVALHAFLVLRRLKGQGEEAQDTAQCLFDLMFADMDRSLREMGAGDLGVGRRVKAMAQGFYGRIRAYERGLEEGDGALAAAIRRNAYGTLRPPEAPAEAAVAALAAYVRACDRSLGQTDLAALIAGEVRFAALPGAVAGKRRALLE